MRFVSAAIATLLIASPACAEGAAYSFNDWSCFLMTKKALYDYAIDEKSVRLNNLNIEEGVAFVTRAPTITFRASVANRTAGNIAVTVEAIGLLNGEPIFALSGDAPMGFIGPGKNEEITGVIAADKGTLGRAGTLCIRVGAYAAAN